jgi:CRP/FNR family transcriptional regulator, cyclic AMP receptor protein
MSEDWAIFLRTGWLARQPAEFQQALLAQTRLVTVQRGEAIYREGDEGRSMYGLISGGVAVLIGPPRLAPRLAHILSPGAWFGVGPVLTGGQRSVEFRASESARLLVLPGAALAQISTAQSENFRAIGGLAMIGHDLATRIAAELLIPSSLRRVAAVIARIATPDPQEAEVGSAGISVTQSQLAEMANVSRNLANTALRELREAGWIATRYHRIQVNNAASLAAFAYEDD